MFEMLVTNVTGSGSNQDATADVKRFFPEGLCCIQTSTMRQEQVCQSHKGPVTWVVRLTDKHHIFSFRDLFFRYSTCVQTI